MKIPINDTIFLDEFNLKDIKRLSHLLNDKEVSGTMLTVPFPYTEKEAEEWIYFTLKQKSSGKQQQNFAIRESGTGDVIGGIGLVLREEKYYFHQSEIGYWIAKEHWNKGLATAAVGTFSYIAFNLFPFLKKLTALVYTHNISSQKVLEKNNFKVEGLLRQHIFKSDNYFDCKHYGLLKDELKIQKTFDLA